MSSPLEGERNDPTHGQNPGTRAPAVGNAQIIIAVEVSYAEGLQ